MKFVEYRKPFRLFIPQYDEIVLFTMSLTCLLLLIAGILSAKPEIDIVSLRENDLKKVLIVMVIPLIFVAGLTLSIYHAFVDRPKTTLEKSIMLFFAVLLNTFSGFMAGGYNLANLPNASVWLMVFPIVNMVNGIILLFMWRVGVLDESSISDRHAPRGKVLLAAAMVLILFYLCQVVYKLMWIQTLSICLVYSVNLIRVIESLVFKPVPARDIEQ